LTIGTYSVPGHISVVEKGFITQKVCEILERLKEKVENNRALKSIDIFQVEGKKYLNTQIVDGILKNLKASQRFLNENEWKAKSSPNLRTQSKSRLNLIGYHFLPLL
jgi:hypothetical protein